MYTPFAHAFAYAIKQTPYAFVAKIILCMYLLYDLAMLISEGMTRSRNAEVKLYTRNSHKLAMFVAR